MSETLTRDAIGTSSSPAHAWMRALELTAPIARNRDRILSDVIHEVAGRLGSAPALLSDQESFTYKDLSERANKYARWALSQGLEKGDVVCLMMGNRPEYMAIWLGITSVGVIVSLLNTNLTGPSLAHCIRTVSPKHMIVAAEYVDVLTSALQHFEPAPAIWAHGPQSTELPRIDIDVALQSGDPLAQDERRSVLIDDLALYIYTSGTTGLPKPAKVSHGRVMQWSHWFSGMMQVLPEDRIYNCLPMYHSVGGVQAPGSVLVAGGTVVVSEKFSVSHFWSDILRWDCTLFQYIGEMCRYLLHAAAIRVGDRASHSTRLRQWTGPGGLGRFSGPFSHSTNSRILRSNRRRCFPVQRPGKARSNRPYSTLPGASILAGSRSFRLRNWRACTRRGRFLHPLRTE